MYVSMGELAAELDCGDRLKKKRPPFFPLHFSPSKCVKIFPFFGGFVLIDFDLMHSWSFFFFFLLEAFSWMDGVLLIYHNLYINRRASGAHFLVFNVRPSLLVCLRRPNIIDAK